MPKVGWALITSAVFNNQNNQPVLDHPLATIDLFNVPNNYTFSLAFCLINLVEDRKYILKIEIFEPDNEEPLLTGEVGIDHKLMVPFDKSSFFSDLNMQNFRFNKFGEHKIVFSLDDKESHKIYFDVRKINE